MKSLWSRFTLIGALTLAGLVSIWAFPMKLGIDLSGGTILVYQVVKGSQSPTFKMDDLIARLKRRINPDGVKDVAIRSIGGDRVEIVLPEATVEKVDEAKKKMTQVGALEFRILANLKHDGRAIKSIQGPDQQYRKDAPKGYRWARLGEIITGKTPTFDKRTLTDRTRKWRGHRYAGRANVTLRGTDFSGNEQVVTLPVDDNTSDTLTVGTNKAEIQGEAEVRNIGSLKSFFRSIASYQINYNPSEIVASDNAIVREQTAEDGLVERFILYKVPPDRQNVTGEDLADVGLTHDDELKPAVSFRLDGPGGKRFGNLTRAHLPEEDGAFKYHLAILLDGDVMSAPVINSYISDSGQISMGRAGPQVTKEVDDLIEVLRAGSLPASLGTVPEREEQIGPTLGKDTIAKGIRAIAISMLVVPLFMVVYYRFAGLVAVVALVLNMVLLLGSMAATGSSFTLPGLAGLALTIGMAVDANVLIFERMREEKERGASMAQQIRNGFSRAWTTILDSNVSTMLSGAVLWYVGTEEIKGFAVTLIMGLIWNLFTAVFVSRAIFDLWYSRGWLKKTTMMKIMDKTNIDFIGPRRLCMIGSVIVIAIGLGTFYLRGGLKQGGGMYNIDFTGGTLLAIRLNEDAPEVKGRSEADRTEFVRRKAGVVPDATIESLNVGGEKRGLRYNIRTTDDDLLRVEKKIEESFGTSLDKVAMTFDKGPPIATAATPAPKPGAAGSKEPAISGRPHWQSRYNLTFNKPEPPALIASAFESVLSAAKVENPATHFEIAYPEGTPKTSAGSRALVLRTDLDQAQAQPSLVALQKSMSTNPDLLFDRHEKFGAAVAGETRNVAAMAIVASWIIIIAYVWLRFKSLTYGLAAVIALVHDVLITLGAVAIAPYIGLGYMKIDLPMIAAFLTLIGFSVNDTIVIFDRIREIKGKTPYLTPQVINDAVNQTLSRTILTSLTAWLVVVILYAFGGEGLHGFAYCLVVGFLSGTYSTIYIASPILIDWMGKDPKASTAKRALVTSR